ncbi:hypothetical protein Ctaglu_43980 [Clostridium tagluense]|uniref:Uncharacterized protein n=2 Tax=Clostridium tagluense TaxID=360422 RepID=A0A401UT96_9CLOT|nr:hypothetical protein Ctaglu_43980 [Clostridium tagluense]
MNNPDFKLAEFDQFKNEAGANDLTNKGVSITYANEADVLNMALFGKNAKFKSETIG